MNSGIMEKAQVAGPKFEAGMLETGNCHAEHKNITKKFRFEGTLLVFRT